MKKTLVLLIAFVALTVFACQDCKECRIVVTNTQSGAVINETTPEEYCSEDLQATENEEPAIYGDEKSEWVCQ